MRWAPNLQLFDPFPSCFAHCAYFPTYDFYNPPHYQLNFGDYYTSGNIYYVAMLHAIMESHRR